MRKLLLLLILIPGLNVYALTGLGICNYGKQTIAEIVCYGPAVLKGTKVTHALKVIGPLKAADMDANTVIVAGDVVLNDSTVRGTVNIMGSLQAQNDQFLQEMHLTTADVFLSHTIVNGDIKVSSPKNKPYIRLFCGSVVNGVIIFDGMQGIVQITDDSQVKGKLVNGTLEFVKKNC